MGNCMVKQESYSKADKPKVKMEEERRKVRYLDYSQSENEISLGQSLEKKAAIKAWGGCNGQLNLDRSPSKMSQKSMLQTIETEASYLSKQRSFKDMERISSYNKDCMEANRSDAMTPWEILQSLRHRKGEK